MRVRTPRFPSSTAIAGSDNSAARTSAAIDVASRFASCVLWEMIRANLIFSVQGTIELELPTSMPKTTKSTATSFTAVPSTSLTDASCCLCGTPWISSGHHVPHEPLVHQSNGQALGPKKMSVSPSTSRNVRSHHRRSSPTNISENVRNSHQRQQKAPASCERLCQKLFHLFLRTRTECRTPDVGAVAVADAVFVGNAASAV